MASASADSHMSLPEEFDAIFKLHQELDTTDEPTGSDKIQKKLLDGISWTESAIQKVNQLELFSRNEEIEEVSSNEIKYMMLSAYLAHFTNLNTHMARIQAVNKSKTCYRDFLRLCNLYHVTNFKLDPGSDDEEEANKGAVVKKSSSRSQADSINAMGRGREGKIERFKEKKRLESRIAELKELVDRDYVDEEVKREFYLSQVKRWAGVAVEEIDSCDLELQMLAHRLSLQKQGGAAAQSASQSKSSAKPFRPFILTKDRLQKAVFGAGYPSLPSLTVDEFYEQKLAEGTLSESVQGGHSMQNWADDPDADQRQLDEEAAEKERKQEVDDEETLQRARAMDDWKDEVRRGDGNRHNMG